MSEDQPISARRRPPIGAVRDLSVGATDADGQRFDQHRPQREIRFGNLLQPYRSRRPRPHRHSPHIASPMPHDLPDAARPPAPTPTTCGSYRPPTPPAADDPGPRRRPARFLDERLAATSLDLSL